MAPLARASERRCRESSDSGVRELRDEDGKAIIEKRVGDDQEIMAKENRAQQEDRRWSRDDGQDDRIIGDSDDSEIHEELRRGCE